ncbi:uncharacterized protein LOC7485818 isoform X2 [Populus trichocarpa]|uniref:uncharacterized protein LOC7485818 isoform X2 n=1 Tax=Populus trichocarpa TaxID=3694 RepID=UPI000D189AD6|nr:uncharacterized protein LOC7485818 isoform X2 [Populus trichocarpa]|eukprot:XP_024465595.1 uncharacterized protein LOC7485818 isoform X2 [Populus trichocarpa]
MPYGSFTTYWHWMGEQSNFIYFRPRQSEKYAAWIMKERRKKRLKKRHDEVVQAKAAKMDRLDQILLDGSLVRLELWLIFSDDIGLPHIFNSVSCSYPLPHEKCAGPNCTNAYKYRDSSIVTTQYMKRCNL